ncbi:MAG: hypothetical protein ACE15C_10345 [Phycisphaerae bacterium]
MNASNDKCRTGLLFNAALLAALCAWPVDLAVGADAATTAPAAGRLEAADSGGAPSKRKITVISPGAYKAVVSQSSGGGITEVYDLSADPECKTNLVWQDRGLLELGWHGAQYKVAGSTQPGNDGCADWPSQGHNELKAQGDMELVESTPARVRVHVKSDFTWWSKQVHKGFGVDCTYTFWPAGRIACAVTVANDGEKPFHWSGEYGPHLTVRSRAGKPNGEPLGFGTPKFPEWKGASAAEELTMAYPTSGEVKAGLLITIPKEQEKLFPRHMRHQGSSIGWDRAGYGSNGIVMEKGYKSTWACMIQLGAQGSALLPELKAPKDGLPIAADYRTPARISGAELVTDDPGDLNKDGFNESEGCYVLKDKGPVTLTFEPAKDSAAFAPAFKIKGWQSQAIVRASVDGKEAQAVAGGDKDGLVVQILGKLPAGKCTIKIGGGDRAP